MIMENAHCLKNGSSLTLNLSKFSMENEAFNEVKLLLRIVGSAEDLQHACEYESQTLKKHSQTHNSNSLSS